MNVRVMENFYSQHNAKPHRGFSSKNKENEEKVYLNFISRNTSIVAI